MDWADITKLIHSLYLPNAIFRPDEHALYKENFVTGNGELQTVMEISISVSRVT